MELGLGEQRCSAVLQVVNDCGGRGGPPVGGDASVGASLVASVDVGVAA